MKTRYLLTYHNPDDSIASTMVIKSSRLPSHDDIMNILNDTHPVRESGGWYSIETVGEEYQQKTLDYDMDRHMRPDPRPEPLPPDDDWKSS